MKGGNSQRGFHFFHTQNRPGPLSVQEIPTLLAVKQDFFKKYEYIQHIETDRDHRDKFSSKIII